jgi:CRISPR-associated protein Cmx8
MSNSIELNYQLGELPSTQHRAGLAGLVLMVNYLPRTHYYKERENAYIHADVQDFGATFRFNLEGLKALFDLAYAATTEERSTTHNIKKYDRIEEEEVTDSNGKKKLSKRYYYSVIQPVGAFIPDWDPSSNDPETGGIWAKLWRDMVWNIIRDRDKKRIPFKNRLNATYSQDAEKTWQALQKPHKTVKQASTYYLGLMEFNAENVSAKDVTRFQFLLNFWPFVAQVYCPTILDKDGRRQRCGYALTIPDVANIKRFTRTFQGILTHRSSKPWGYIPLESSIDLPEEGALNLLQLLSERIAYDIGSSQLKSTVLGVEIIHAEKIKNSVKIHTTNYIEPIRAQQDRYQQIKDDYWCPWFRKQRLLNLIDSFSEEQDSISFSQQQKPELPAWYDFDALLSRIPRKWLKDFYFSHDARQLFDSEVPKGDNMETQVRHYARIVYQVCQHYVLSKLKNKYGMEWDKKQNCPVQSSHPISKAQFNEKKEKIASDAFLAVRSRTESKAFIDYFVSTLYPFIRQEEFADFAEVLFNQSDEIRALTLLALSSQFPWQAKSENGQSQES